MSLPIEVKATLYDVARKEVRQLVAGMLCREIVHSAAGIGIGFGPEDDDVIDAFVESWRPVAFLVSEDAAHMVDAERAAEVACGFAWDLGAAQAEIERLREALGECLMRLTDAAADIRPTDPKHAKDIDETIRRYWLLPQKKEAP